MDNDEQRKGPQRQPKEDRQRFEKGQEVREEQTRNISEEASEEDRRKWEEPRDISREVSEIPDEAYGRRQRVREEQEHSDEESQSE